MKGENLEKLAQVFERIENINQMAQMKALPDSIHMEGIRPALPELMADLKAIYLDEGGEEL